MIDTVLLRQVILLMIALGVPTVFLIFRREKMLLVWVGATLFVQVFDTALITNLPAGRVVGILYLPCAILSFPNIISNRNFRYALWSVAYLGVLAIVFGFILPWPDLTHVRPYTLRAEGKAVIYFFRTVSDLSLALFIFLQCRSREAVVRLRQGLLAGALLTSFAGLIQEVFGLNLYVAITGLRTDLLARIIRPQGLSYEPRGLGLAAVWGFFLAFAPGRKISKRSLLAGLICAAGFAVAGSFSAVAMFIAGAVVAVWVGLGTAIGRRRFVTIAALSLLAAIIWILGTDIRQRTAFYLDPSNRIGDVPVKNLVDQVVYRLDIYDAAALAFLVHNPLYAFVGTGPGLVCLPATAYIPPGKYSVIWDVTLGKGLDSPPTLGILLEVANGGMLALALWLAQILVAFRWTYPRRKIAPSGWTFSDWVFMGRFIRFGVVFYIVQNSVSPVWAVVSGFLFLAAGCRSAKRRAVPEALARTLVVNGDLDSRAIGRRKYI